MNFIDTLILTFNCAIAAAGMSCSANGTTEIATNIAFSLGSEWQPVPTVSATYTFKDDISKKTLTTKTLTPATAPIGRFLF